jgi:GMP synthase-like glutamine amidotransferase
MKKLSIHTLLHVPYEGLGCIEEWITAQNHSHSYTRFFEDFHLPEPDEVDWLIVMGGPMSVYEESAYPWMKEEKAFIRKVIDSGKIVIGICLGSQLIAKVLGAKVYPNDQKEIGWLAIKLTENARNNKYFMHLPTEFPVFHWHGDTYDLPVGCSRLFQSDFTFNQGFIYDNRVLALQFHFEVTTQLLNNMVANGVDELNPSVTIHSANEILQHQDWIDDNNQKLFEILDLLAADDRNCNGR